MQLLCQGTYPLSFRRLGLEFSFLGNVTLILALRESRTCHGIYVVGAVSVAVREGRSSLLFVGGTQGANPENQTLVHSTWLFVPEQITPYHITWMPSTKSLCTPTTLLRQENGKSMVINGTSTLASQ
jgi:hypothetical protein